MRYGVPFLPYTLLQASKVGDAPQALRPLSVSDALSQESGERTINEKLLALQQELLKKAHNKEAYDEIADEIFRLRELKQQTTVDTVTRDEQIKRITALQDFIRSQPAELTEFDEALVKRWLRKITVWTDKYTVELKSGLNVDIDAES